MAGLGGSLGSPWPPLAICSWLQNERRQFDFQIEHFSSTSKSLNFVNFEEKKKFF
jgi:hypothetical protein